MNTWITKPTLASLRALLNDLEADGWSPDQHIQIGQVWNMPEVFTITPVVEWIGALEAFPKYLLEKQSITQ